MPLSQTIHFQDVSFVYPSMGEPLFERLSLQVGAGWTGIVGPNGAGKTTLLHLACGHVEPTSGTISRPRPVIDCPQRTDDPPEGFRSFLESIDARGCALRGQLNVSNDWLDRWPTLSHGERKRAQIAVALWRDPRVLAVDEPTNHIDAEARQMLIGALRTFRGVGLLVSHDRQLLDLLCEQCVFIDPPDVTVRPGGYTKGVELAKADQARARHEKEQARREAARLHSEAAARAREANSADRKRSKRHLDKHDSDGRAKINLARVSGKDGQAGRKLRQLAGRLQRTEQRVSAIHVKKERALSAELTGEISRRDTLVHLPGGTIPLGATRKMSFPDLLIRPADRIAITGPNGAGKSTLVRHVLAHIELTPERIVVVPQELDRDAAVRIAGDVRAMEAGTLGKVMSAVALLGSDPRRILETDEPSAGEARKLLLALGMARTPNLIVMDEPTNHLDLPSIECLENALAECRCALLLVSHDLRFLARLTTSRWDLVRDEHDDTSLVTSAGTIPSLTSSEG